MDAGAIHTAQPVYCDYQPWREWDAQGFPSLYIDSVRLNELLPDDWSHRRYVYIVLETDFYGGDGPQFVFEIDRWSSGYTENPGWYRAHDTLLEPVPGTPLYAGINQAITATKWRNR